MSYDIYTFSFFVAMQHEDYRKVKMLKALLTTKEVMLVGVNNEGIDDI